MTKNLLSTLLFLITQVYSAQAQEALFRAQQITSPEIHDDSSVTFRLSAPNAKSVQITGDLLPTVKIETPQGSFDGPGKAELTKDDQGVWTYNSDPLHPELYGYSFIVDGFTTTDPNNPFLIRDVASVTNILIVGDGQADLYRTNDIPHGSVTRRWYDSPELGMDR